MDYHRILIIFSLLSVLNFVFVSAEEPVCNVETPNAAYCSDLKTLMTCSGGSWVPKDCGASYTKDYCSSNNEICTDTTTSGCIDPGICSSNTVTKCSTCTYGCSEGKCLAGTPVSTTPTTNPNPTTPTNIPPATTAPVTTTPITTGIPAIAPTKICTDSDNNNFYEKGIMKGAADDSGHWDLCGNDKTLTEYYCENNEAKKIAYDCPNGCNDGACIKGEPLSEQVTCIFKNSDKEQKCYLAGDNSRFFCSGKDSCVMNVKGYKGEKLIWKSSCGSYIPTVIDGQNENAEFECNIGETTTTIIKNKGFRNAYFQCYDEAESKSSEREACKTAEFWKKFAENFCQSHCKGEKCGVNSFSITDECYIEEQTIPPATTIGNPKAAQGMLYYFKTDDCQVCQDMKKEFEILRQKGFFNNFGEFVYDMNDKNVPEKFKIKTVPSIVIYKGECLFKKEGFIKAEEIENWAYESNCEKKEDETKDKVIEPSLICKDSCPSEDKCYPFGYRKSGKYCSDTGGFTEQLKEDLTCDNNFECSSNVCISGQCVSEGLMKKVLSWFKRMFDRE